MYQVICVTKGKEYELLNFADEEYIIYNPKLTMEINKAGSFEFILIRGHPNYSKVQPMISVIKIYQDNRWIFSGRVCDGTRDFYDCKTVYCEGMLAYLCDSIVRPHSFSGLTNAFIVKKIEEHNARVDGWRQFEIGTIIDSADSKLETECNEYPSTMDEMQEILVQEKGMHLEAIENAAGSQIINCTKEILHHNSQTICFGENILDLEDYISGTALKTVIIGLGKAGKSGNKISYTAENAEGIAMYGRIEGKKEFAEISTEAELSKKTEEYLQTIKDLSRTITINAVDLNLTDREIETLSLGYVRVESKPHGIEGDMILSKIVKNLTAPENDSLVLGWEGNYYTDNIKKELKKRTGVSGATESDLKAMTKEELESILV